MTHTDLTMPLPGQRKAFIRDGALVLYFDNAETPFVARFDLDSLAQANFEVADKHENIYPLTLRDFSGQVQIVGQFATKADAHQALYAILQALLSHKDDDAEIKSPCTFWCALRNVIKWTLLLIGAVVVVYNLLVIAARPFATRYQPAQMQSEPQQEPAQEQGAADEGVSEAPAASNDLSTIPEGEAVDADSILAPAATTEPDAKAE